MSTTYKTIAGDTFDLISRKVYGTEKEASRIASANPGTVEPLAVGVSLFIPLLQPVAPSKAPANTPNEVALLIDNVRFRFWSSMRITRSIDSFSTISLSAPFAKEHRAIFRPLSFKPMVVTVGGVPLFTGTMMGVIPTVSAEGKTINVNGYSRAGVLNDCTPPINLNPLEFDGYGLQRIANTLTKPFGIPVKFVDSQGAAFQRVASAATKKIFDFLIELAAQRNLVITDNAAGDLVFWKAITSGVPVAKLVQGESPLISVTPTFNPQAYYSHLTGMGPTIVGVDGTNYTIKNKHVSGVLRPYNFTATDSMDSDLQQSTKTKVGRMLGSMVSYNAQVLTWRDANGALWAPNTLISVVAPDAMIYKPYNFLIKSVELSRDDKETASLTLVLPGAYRGELPESLPWDV